MRIFTFSLSLPLSGARDTAAAREGGKGIKPKLIGMTYCYSDQTGNF
jgi:hypothetical protein